MNPKVKQLADLASERFKESLGSGAEPGPYYYNKFVDEFAKLMLAEVEEVLTEVYREIPLECCGHIIYAEEKIQKHFGVFLDN